MNHCQPTLSADAAQMLDTLNGTADNAVRPTEKPVVTHDRSMYSQVLPDYGSERGSLFYCPMQVGG